MTENILHDFESYDVIVIGGGIGGLTAANYLAKNGRSVLLAEQHNRLGGLATWFNRKGGHIFDVSLHGFPFGMVKSCRKYWTQEIANEIIQLKDIRFINPQFNFSTTFDKEDFSAKLTSVFQVPQDTVKSFFEHLEKMNFYDDDTRTTRQLFEEFFPNRNDIQRLLLEPITYANGSTLDDPAITYGIVFSNFMSKGVFTFRGGTDYFINLLSKELIKNGVKICKNSLVEKVLIGKNGSVNGVLMNGKEIRCKSVVSNTNLKYLVEKLVEQTKVPKDLLETSKNVRLNSSSCQVYLGIKSGEEIPEIGDLIFTSEAKDFTSDELKDFHTKSRTFSIYYPELRPQNKQKRYAIVASMNALWSDWANLNEKEYSFHKNRICQESIDSLEKLIPNIREKIDWAEVATPKTFNRYTLHPEGTSFGTKFEGLSLSMNLPNIIPGLYHTGSVGIIMSGWLGAMNHGVISANKTDKYLSQFTNIS